MGLKIDRIKSMCDLQGSGHFAGATAASVGWNDTVSEAGLRWTDILLAMKSMCGATA